MPLGTIISVKSLSKAYASRSKAKIIAIENVSFEVEEGSFLSIVGPSGCGKSTLLKAVAGLVSPTTGDVFVFNESVKDAWCDLFFNW